MRNTFLVLAGILCFLSCSDNSFTGTVSDTDTGKSALVYNPDLTPAVGAIVRVFESNDTTRKSVFETVTDSFGRYSLTSIPKGTYNIFTRKDSLVSFQDSAFISPAVNTVKSDTLGSPGTITATVGLQPNHDKRTVTAQIIGTDLYSNVTSDGKFTISGIAKGYYTLRLTTTLTDYTPTLVKLYVDGNKPDTIKDTLWMIYTGIPVVTGIQAAYDTMKGIVHLNWNKVQYSNIQDYIIYRDYYNTVNLSTNPFAAITDTAFTDTIFNSKLISGSFSFSDTNDYHFKYRIAVRSNVNAIGLTYKNIDVIAVSPVKVKTIFTFLSYSQTGNALTGAIRKNDTFNIVCQAVNPNRQLNKIRWLDTDKNVLLKTVTVNSATNLITDTLEYCYNETGVKKIECTVADLAGVECHDTVIFNIIDDKPVVNFPDSIIYSGTPFKLNATIQMQYGNLKKIEWDIGNTGTFTEVSKTDTTITFPDTFFSSDYECVLRVTDDNMSVVIDTLHLRSWLVWEKVALPFSDKGQLASFTIFNNKIYVLEDLYTAGKFSLYKSDNGMDWTCIKDSMPFKYPSSASLIGFKDTLWIIQNQYVHTDMYPATGDSSWLWSSIDGLNWNSNGLLEAYDPLKTNKNIWTNYSEANFRSYSNTVYGICYEVGSPVVVTTSEMRMWTKFYLTPYIKNNSFEIINNQFWFLCTDSWMDTTLRSCFSDDLKSLSIQNIKGLPGNGITA